RRAVLSLGAGRADWRSFARGRVAGFTGPAWGGPSAKDRNQEGLVLLKGEMAMIEFRTGDILTADAEAIVNTVNCVGIMGRGIALQLKNAFPANFKAYEAACAREEVQPGRMFVFETDTLTNPKYIINFPTKRHWRGKSRIEDIESGLKALIDEIRARGIRAIAIPPLGSGL